MTEYQLSKGNEFLALEKGLERSIQFIENDVECNRATDWFANMPTETLDKLQTELVRFLSVLHNKIKDEREAL